jgi:hypothetical protein
VPLRVHKHSVIRVGDSQVLLEIVVREFNDGAEQEAIARAFPTCPLCAANAA